MPAPGVHDPLVIPTSGRIRARLARTAFPLVLVIVSAIAFAACASTSSGPSASRGARATSPGSVAGASHSASGGDAGSPASTAPPSDAVLIGAGDIGICGSSADRDVGRLIAGIPGTVFADGDLAYDSGTASQFSDCYGTAWGDLKARTRPVPGNHEWRTPGLTGYLGYWGSAATNAAGDSWYSFDLGSWHVVVLDADCSKVGGCGPTSKEGSWLAADLGASTARCTIALWHQPRFSSGTHGNDPTVASFWDALAAAHADVIVNGHDHDYERFAPQDPNGASDPTNGIREFVVGTGGSPLRGFAKIRANSEFRQSSAHGALELILHPTSYDWRFIAVGGTVLDSGSSPCH